MRYPAFLSFVLILLLITAISISAQPRKNLRALQDEAAKAYDQKRYDEAAEKYGQIIAMMPNNPVAHFHKGFALFNLKRYDDALTEFNTALSQGHPALEVYRVRAFIYNEQKNYDAALADVTKGLALAPNDPMLLRGAVEVNIQRQAYGDAIAAAQRVLKVAPNDAQMQYNLARAYFGMGDANGQRTAAESALARGTVFPAESYFLRGDACQKLRDLACAIDAFQKGIAIKPELIDFHRRLAQVFKDENRILDALNLLKKAQPLFPNDGRLFMDTSRLYGLIDRPDDAVQAARGAVQLLQNNADAYTNLCRAYNDTKAYDAAVIACNNALKLSPGDGETYFYLGRAYNLLGKDADATKAYAQAVKGLIDATQREMWSPDNWYVLGNAYFANSQRDKAVEAYQKALTLAPKFARAHYNLGRVFLVMKNKPGAMEQYTALQTLDGKLATSLKSEIDRM